MFIDELIGFTLPAAMFLFGNPTLSLFNFAHLIILWVVILNIGGFMYSLFAFNNGHHGPEIVHEGDEFDNLDFGVYQIMTIVDRKEIGDNLFRVLAYFGLHCLHHLFPTLDHSVLPHLQDVFKTTCEEFSVRSEETTILKAMIDQFKQLDRKTQNTLE